MPALRERLTRTAHASVLLILTFGLGACAGESNKERRSSSSLSSSSYSSSSSSKSSNSTASTPDTPSPSGEAPLAIAPNDPAIRYIGRVALTPEAAQFDWANTQINFRVEASSVELLFDDGVNDYNVFVDGELQSVVSTAPATTVYPVALGPGAHDVLVTKRTGPNFGAGRFLGIKLPEGGKLLESPAPAARRIEFIGDSYTVGYGNEGPGLDCGGTYRPYENSYLSYAPIVARALNADSHSIAISGFGVVRNYGDANTTSTTPVPFYYNRTLMTREDLPWDFQSWIPNAVVIKLGTNDYSTEPSPPASAFIHGIHDLIKQVNHAYGQVPIFLLADSSLSQLVANMQTAARQQQEMGNSQVRFVQVAHPPQSQLGCDWHPLVAGHQAMAAELVAAIKPVMGWQ